MSVASRQEATERAVSLALRTLPSASHLWNFGFGANINPWKLQQKRGIEPLETAPGSIAGWQIRFNHRGGFGNIVPCGSGFDAPSLSPQISQPQAVHGVLLKLSLSDFGKLAGMEHQYEASPVTVRSYAGHEVLAFAFTSPVAFQTVKPDLLPQRRYIKLIAEGARQMGLDRAYCKWLDQVPFIGDQLRHDDYYVCGGLVDAAPNARQASSDREGQTRRWVARGQSAAQPYPQPPQQDGHAKGTDRGRGRGRGRQQGGCDGGSRIDVRADSKDDLRFTVVSETRAAAGICIDGSGCLYVSESQSNCVKEVPLATFSGSGMRSLPVCADSLDIFAGGRGGGARADQLSRPWRICFGAVRGSHGGGLYVSDRNNARVQCWQQGQKPKTVAGGLGAGSGLHQLDQPVAVAVHPETADVYVSDRANHRVVRWPPGAAEGLLVCGGAGFGCGLTQLACPAGVHVTREGVVYVADEANNRVLRWRPGADSGEVVAGGKGAGAGSEQLYHPLGVWVDEEESMLYVADSLNYRVQRWALQTDEAVVTVAGCGTSGKGATQLGQPMSVLRDLCGTLIVADSDNSRVQAFLPDEQARVASSTPHRPAEVNEARRGRCTRYQNHSGFGFVLGDDGVRYFAHHSDIASAPPGSRPWWMYGYPTMQQGALVEFEARRDDKWKWRATNIKEVSS